MISLALLFLASPAASVQAETPVLTEHARIGMPEGLWPDGYGRAIALSSSTAVIGAPLDGRSGSVTVYRRGRDGWEQEARLVPEGGSPGERFGTAVALSGDLAVVGAPYADDKAGAWYVFERAGAQWPQRGRFDKELWPTGPDNTEARLGASVAIDGETIVIGAPGSAVAYVAARNADHLYGWSMPEAVLIAEGGPNDWAPGKPGDDWQPEADEFGSSVAIWNDTIAVGARGADAFGVSSGAVSVFVREAVQEEDPGGEVWSHHVPRRFRWKLEATLTPEDGEAGDRFGAQVALCGDLLGVGAPGESTRGVEAGAVYAFLRDPSDDNGGWSQDAKLYASDAAAGDRFGNVALLGTALAVGAPGKDLGGTVGRDTGAAYVFGRASDSATGAAAGRWTERARLAASDASPRDAFGSSVALSGFTVAVAAPTEDVGRRFPAYLFDLSSRFLSGAARSTVAETVREVVSDGSWEVISQHPEHGPEVGVIAPVIEGAVDGSDLPALVMPPPCEVQFTVSQEDGPVVLRAAAGVDHTFLPRRLKGLELIRLGYEILVNDEPVFEAEVEPLFRGDVGNRRWRRLVDPEQRLDGLALGGLPLRPGDVVTLRTSVVHPDEGVEIDATELPRIASGFGEVELVRRGDHEPERASSEKPNIVMIVMDTLRADHLSCYVPPEDGEPRLTPVLDSLADRGVLFENAFAASSWTWPSTASLLTGLWPEAHGVVSDESCYLAAELETLPESLAASGYATGAFSCNPLIVPDKNFDQGFQYFDRPLGRGFRNTHEVIGDVEAWIGAHASERFFLYLHLADTHFPYEPVEEALELVPGEAPEGYPDFGLVAYHRELLKNEGRGRDGTLDLDAVVPPDHVAWMRRAYDQGVASADHYVGEIVRAIERLGLDERTLIVFTSDHGEELCERGLATHGQSLHPELVRAPLILAGPGVPSGLRVERPVSNRHLAPTLARIGAVGVGAQPTSDNVAASPMADVTDAVDLLQTSELPVRTLFLSTEHGFWNGRSVLPIHGLRTGRWSLHHAPTGMPWGADEDAVLPPAQPGELVGELRLYDLLQDPDEQIDVSAEYPEIVEVLFAELVRHLEGAEAAAVAAPVEADEATLRMLRDIGYIGDDE
jgi:arylsulfatase A-like enzyme